MKRKGRKGLLARLRFWLGGLVVLLVAIVVAGYAVISSYDFEELRGEIERQAEAVTGRKLTISGPIDFKVSLTPAVTLEDVTFANADWGSRPAMATVKRFELEVALLPLLTGDLHARRLVLVEPDILLETGPQGEGNWTFGATTASDETAPSDDAAKLPTFEQVTLRGGRLVFRGAGDPLTLEIERLDLAAADSSSPVSLALVGRYNGSPFQANGTLGSLGQLAVGSQPLPLALVLRSGASELSLQGEIAQPQAGSGLNFDVSGKGRSLADLSPFADGDLPPLDPWSLDAKLAQDGTIYRLSGLALGLGESDLAGTASIDLGKDRPLVTAALTANRIRLADVTGPEPEGAVDDGRIFSDRPLPLDALKLFDAEVKLAAASFEPSEKLKLENVDLLLALKGGQLKVAPFAATLAAGKLAGGLDLDASVQPPTVALALTGKQVDYGRLLRELAVDDTVEGKLDLELAVSGSGNSLHAMASSLKGKSSLVGGEGRLDNTLVTLVSADLLGLLGPLFGSKEAMEISCLVSRFDIADGVAVSSAQLLHAENFTLQGGGEIDLEAERIDMLFEPKSSLPSLTSLAIPFRIQGPLTDPGVIPDPLGTALTAAKTAGSIIMPLAGLGILLGDAVLGAGNPCTAALEAGASGQSQEKSVIDKATEGVGETLDSIGKGIKGLFGN